MTFVGSPGFRHDAEQRIGVLLVNLGTPPAPTAAGIRSFLRRFLADPRVVELPRWFWLPLLYLVILPFRPRKVAPGYRKIWSDEGSPLKVQCRRLTERLNERAARSGQPVLYRMAMSYSEPFIDEALGELKRHGCCSVTVLPLYPQYAGSTTGAVFAAVTRCLNRWRWVPALHFVGGYADHPLYIEALAASIRRHRQSPVGKGPGEGAEGEVRSRLLFSFHGTPSKSLLQGDPYHCQCHKSARLVAAELGLAANDWQLSFQSRFGRAPWLQPSTDETLIRLARGGEAVEVVCPGFAVDCVETLEEIALSGREAFFAAGGTRFDYIPALNDGEGHLQLLESLSLQPWLQTLERLRQLNSDEERRQRSERARSLGAVEGGFDSG